MHEEMHEINQPEGLSELQRLVNHSLSLFVVSDFGIALRTNHFSVDSDSICGEWLTVKGKSLRRGWPSKPVYIISTLNLKGQ